jgi:hypothetical protein
MELFLLFWFTVSRLTRHAPESFVMADPQSLHLVTIGLPLFVAAFALLLIACAPLLHSTLKTAERFPLKAKLRTGIRRQKWSEMRRTGAPGPFGFPGTFPFPRIGR